MKIGIDASRANLATKTGTEWYAFNLIEELKKIIPLEYQVILYLKEPLRGDLKILPKNWQAKVLKWPPRYLWTQFRLSMEMLKFWNRPDLLFIPAHTIPFIHPKKTVLVTHDIGFEKKPQLYSPSDLGYHRFAMRFAAKHAYKIISVSHFTKREIMDLYRLDPNRIYVVHNGYNNLADYPDKQYFSAILKKYKISQPYLLFVGRLEQKKNIPKLIEAFFILKNKYKIPHKLVLLGIPGFNYEKIKSNIIEYKLQNEIIEVGYTEKYDLKIILKHADLFIFPSLYEGFGIPVLEAMSVGTPVACSKIPALEEVAADAAYYFNPDNQNDIADKIATILNDSGLKNKLRNTGFEQIKKFSFSKCAQETWKIIKICTKNT